MKLQLCPNLSGFQDRGSILLNLPKVKAASRKLTASSVFNSSEYLFSLTFCFNQIQYSYPLSNSASFFEIITFSGKPCANVSAFSIHDYGRGLS